METKIFYVFCVLCLMCISMGCTEEKYETISYYFYESGPNLLLLDIKDNMSDIKVSINDIETEEFLYGEALWDDNVILVGVKGKEFNPDTKIRISYIFNGTRSEVTRLVGDAHFVDQSPYREGFYRDNITLTRG